MNLDKKSCFGPAMRRRVVLTALLVTACASPVRAANLDRALLKQAPAILEELADRKYGHVGVLPFQVKKDGLPASYSAAPLGINLPGRLENVLILCQSGDSKTPIGIIRDAAGEASRAGVGAWTRTNFSYKALFNTRYPLAWGNERVRPDAFLSGTVTVLPGRKAVQVVVHLFDRSSRSGGIIRMDTVADFEVPADRPLLRDLGYGYVLPRSSLRKGVTARQRDAFALEQVEEDEDDSKGKKELGPRPTPDNVAGMAFEIRYNGKKQTIRPLSPGNPGSREWQVDPVKEGTKVTMALTRVLRENRRLGVVLKVNGRSTFGMEEADSLRCSKWLYDVKTHLNRADIFDGFYLDAAGKDVRRFRVLSAEESARRAEELGDRAGWIDIDVYATGESTTTEESDVEEITVTTRGRARSTTAKPRTLKEAREQIARENNIRLPRVKGRSVGGVIVDEPLPERGPPIFKDKLPNPVHVGGISIKYWDRAAAKRLAD